MAKERIAKILSRIQVMDENHVRQKLDEVLSSFQKRHTSLIQFFENRFEKVKRYTGKNKNLSKERKLLIGAYFTQEYAIESSALFNPSMVWHPDQSGVAMGSKRFILSLRAIGEGHISSITFRTGVISAKYMINMDESSRYVTTADNRPDQQFEKKLFRRKMSELGLLDMFSESILNTLPDYFTFSELKAGVKAILNQHNVGRNEIVASNIIMLARSNYEISFLPMQDLSARVIYPSAP
ncbi:MAG: glycosidase, partial [Oligoflexia bacterium]|nr:glycosidase [Oligoflexia bacterium]